MARLTDYSKWDKLEDSDDENEEAERVRAQPSARQKNPLGSCVLLPTTCQPRSTLAPELAMVGRELLRSSVSHRDSKRLQDNCSRELTLLQKKRWKRQGV
jgi:hypothetical protein